jgi:hypothetical protein
MAMAAGSLTFMVWNPQTKNSFQTQRVSVSPRGRDDALRFGLVFVARAAPCNSSSHYYIDVSDNGAGSGPGSSGWDTNTPGTSGAPCQVYIANWTDTSISLVVNAPVNKQSLYQASNASSAFLSPLSDFSAFTFAPPPGPIGCPVMAGDNLTFTVTNPQTGNSAPIPKVPVSAPTGTTLF